MLVCDRDIMELDVSILTTTVCETILVTVIVSDWNTRAWTFLEAFRARQTTHLLCKHNAVLSLQKVIQTVQQKGILDIGNLVLAMPHFLPAFDDQELARSKSGSRQEYQAGYLSIETSGSLLSHRPASRPGDDMVIWSLLISEKTVFHGAESFWKAMQGPILQVSTVTGRITSRGGRVRTGYLVSSAPRLKVRGLGWAPASPTFSSSNQLAADGFGSFFDDGDSARGWVTPDGLVADWKLWKFDTTDFWHLSISGFPRNLKRIRAQFLKGYSWGALLCPFEERYGAGTERWWDEGGRMRRTIVVICGTNEKDGSIVEKYTFNNTEPVRPKWNNNTEVVGWNWRGVYVWDDVEPLPEWKRAKMFLIV